jgi:KUP system potassium uptake protein
VTPAFDDYILPLTLLIIAGLFFFQYRGTAAVSTLFGPVTVVWFLTMGVFGALHIGDDPGILAALNPAHAAGYVVQNGVGALLVLGSIFLAVTGGEALYADMGHFGKTPIRIAWLGLVWPALTLSYLGQGALVLAHPEAASNPFFLSAPAGLLLPLVILATFATVIASQAVISGLFSLVNQAVRTGLLPRIEALHTSSTEYGQIYVPRVNTLLAVAVMIVVLSFGSSSNLAAAYGVAVIGVMILTTILASFVFRRVWRWPLALVLLVVAPILLLEAVFLGANLLKVHDGGWVPILIAATAVLLMWTWIRGTRHVQEQARRGATSTGALVEMLSRSRSLQVVPGTAVFLTSDPDIAPAALMHNIKHNHVLHERNIIASVVVEARPYVAEPQRVTIARLAERFIRIDLHFGYMEETNVPRALALARKQGVKFDIMSTSFFLNRRTFRTSKTQGLPAWQESLYIALSRSAANATDFYRLPTNRVIELGQQILI